MQEAGAAGGGTGTHLSQSTALFSTPSRFILQSQSPEACVLLCPCTACIACSFHHHLVEAYRPHASHLRVVAGHTVLATWGDHGQGQKGGSRPSSSLASLQALERCNFLGGRLGLLQAMSSGLLIGLQCFARHLKMYCVHRCVYVIGFNNSQNPEPTALRLYARAAFLSAEAQMAEIIGSVEYLSR